MATVPAGAVGPANSVQPVAANFPSLFAVDINEDNFISTLTNGEQTWLGLNFYAPWSPHSQKFEPSFEQLALTFNGYPKSKTLVGHVNCVTSAALCTKFGISASLPSFFLGTFEEWLQAFGQIQAEDWAQSSTASVPVVDSTNTIDPLVFFNKSSPLIIQGHERLVVSGASLVECATRCIHQIWCQSFEFSPPTVGDKCSLQDVVISSVGTVEEVTGRNGYADLVYYERRAGALTQLAGLGVSETIGSATKTHQIYLKISQETKQYVPFKGAAAFATQMQGELRKAKGREERGSDASGAGEHSVNVSAVAELVSKMRRVDLWDVRTAVAVALRTAWSQQTGDARQQQALEDFVETLCRSYPEVECRPSFCKLRSDMMYNLEQTGLTQTGAAASRIFEVEFRLCGDSWESMRTGWHACEGTWPNTRGYPCGLWALFHSLVGVAPTALDAVDALRAVIGFVSNFFECTECRDNFRRLVTPRLKSVHTKAQVALLLWTAHNKINRIAQDDAADALNSNWILGDPFFPKATWPSATLCPKCYPYTKGKASKAQDLEKDFGMNTGEVYKFIDGFYGQTSGRLAVSDWHPWTWEQTTEGDEGHLQHGGHAPGTADGVTSVSGEYEFLAIGELFGSDEESSGAEAEGTKTGVRLGRATPAGRAAGAVLLLVVWVGSVVLLYLLFRKYRINFMARSIEMRPIYSVVSTGSKDPEDEDADALFKQATSSHASDEIQISTERTSLYGAPTYPEEKGDV